MPQNPRFDPGSPRAKLLDLLTVMFPPEGLREMKCDGCGFDYPWLVRYSDRPDGGRCAECFLLVELHSM